MELREWMVLHVRHKDVLARRLLEVREERDHVVFAYKDGDVKGYAIETLKPVQGKAIVVTLQREENIAELIRNWKAYAENPELTVVFANPARNEKWSVKPALHDKISDGDLAAGIRSMASDVTHA